MDNLLNDIETNTSSIEQKQALLQQTINNLWTENVFLKNKIRIEHDMTRDILVIFQDNSIKKFKKEYLGLNKLHLLLFLKYKLDKSQVLGLFQNNPNFEVKTIRSKIFIRKL